MSFPHKFESWLTHSEYNLPASSSLTKYTDGCCWSLAALYNKLYNSVYSTQYRLNNVGLRNISSDKPQRPILFISMGAPVCKNI